MQYSNRIFTYFLIVQALFIAEEQLFSGVWVGPGSLMNDGNNWQSGFPPFPGDDLLFPLIPGTNSLINDLSPNPFTLGAASLTGQYEFSGNGFNVNRDSSFTINSNSLIAMSNTIAILEEWFADLSENSFLTLSGAISGDQLTIHSASAFNSVTLSGNNASWSGDLELTGNMTLIVGNANALGSIDTILFGHDSEITIEANSSFTFNANTALTPNSSSSILLDTNSNTITMNASVLANGAPFTITGNGTVQVNSSGNTFNTLLVNGGTLQIGAAASALGPNAAVTISSGAAADFQDFSNTIYSLTNNGAVSAGDEITTAIGYAQSSTTTGSLTLDISNAAGPTYGQITATSGSISINSGSTLTITNSGGLSPIAGDPGLTLLSGTSRKGRFATPVTQPFAGASLSYSPTTVTLDFSNCNASWNATTSGTWGDSVSAPNWTPGCAPGVGNVASDADVATFPSVTGASAAITATLANNAGNAAQPVTLLGLVFNSQATAYTIQPFSGSSTITLATPAGGSSPYIDVFLGNHTINAPIILSDDSRISLSSGGQLTLGSGAAVTGNLQLLIHEDGGSGVVINEAPISIGSLLVQGGTVRNSATISLTTTGTLSGNAANSAAAALINTSTISAGTTWTVGGGGSSNLQNLSGGQISGNASFRILGGVSYNDASSTLGKATAPFTLSGGALQTAGPVLASLFTQSGASTLQIDILNAASSGHLVQVNGNANLGGTLTVNALSGFSLAVGQTVDLITASGLVARNNQQYAFSGFSGSVIPVVRYLDHAVQLEIYPTLENHSGATVQMLHSSISEHNIRIERKCLQLRDRWSLPLPKEQSAFSSDTMAMAENGFSNLVALGPVEERQEKLTEKIQLSQQPLADPWSLYAGPIGAFGDIQTKGNQPGFSHHSVGGLAGFDYAFSKTQDDLPYNFGLGAVVDFKKVWGKGKEDWGNFTSAILHSSFYATLVPVLVPELAYDGILGFGYHWDTFNRHAGPFLQDMATGTPSGTLFDCLFAIEYTFSQKKYAGMPANFRLIPFANVQYVRVQSLGYKEHGAGNFDLKVAFQSAASLTTFLGTRATYLYKGASFTLLSEFDGGWQHEYADQNRAVNVAAFHVTPQTFTVTTVGAGRNSALIGIDLFSTIHDRWQVEFSTNYTWNSLFYNLSFFLGLGAQF